ncbi:MAG TPA: hypothetical protein VLR50_07155 [Desulfobacterales bacterium]|nr:hypothetical protein [Desulfobacterales bacterium]
MTAPPVHPRHRNCGRAAVPTDTPHILLVNPWIHDFAAHDFWAGPLGLLTLAGILRQHGCRVSYIDCLDRFHPRGPQGDPRARFGCGPFRKARLPKPAVFGDVPRRFSRYGWRSETPAVLHLTLPRSLLYSAARLQAGGGRTGPKRTSRGTQMTLGPPTSFQKFAETMHHKDSEFIPQQHHQENAPCCT